ncbi:Regulator of protease activity HflC (Stomatin/prohibitin superfamily) [Beijerinckiaceae bacterium RH AL1]|nr:Regulator of protease activity HflC (Stomatin/prohibitin superfamily) [Beijerinckiaceae bacterium RH AL8]VVB43789.1 Regulator of protease activity HflC (Stomatin/prohibitin superfamily) [Beijerinckiaceae bacterium RH CH11]VVC54004.1 Regulator of protease activity HflC (Stomatin/prohibitin superfamily) [Beijerinckiaceae bacterium RH AL1]
MNPAEITLSMTFITILVIIVLVILAAGLFTVEQQNRAIVERFGKFSRVAGPGLNVKIPLFDRVAATINLMVNQVQLEADTKTKDNVFVKIHFAVNYRIEAGRETLAYYGLADIQAQITAYALDSVRSQVPTMDLDHVFERKDDISVAIQEHVGPAMGQYGIIIVSCLVIDITPAAQVVAAMNDIQAQARLQVAAASKGEAEKILVVKRAEAEAASKRLQGEGIAGQRKAIMEGYQASVEEFQKHVSGVPAAEVMQMLLLTQYFDTLKEFGTSTAAKVLLVPHSPAAMKDFGDQIRNAVLIGEEMADVPEPPARPRGAGHGGQGGGPARPDQGAGAPPTSCSWNRGAS